MIRRVYSRDPVYSLLLTFGLAFIIQDVCRYIWGPNGLPLGDARRAGRTAQRRPVLHHLVSHLHGGRSSSSRWPGCSPSCATPGSACASAPARWTWKPSPRWASTSACCASFNFARRLACWRAWPACWPAGQIGLNPNMGDDLLMPSFIAIIVGGVGSLTGTLLGGLLIGVAAALTTVVWPSRQRGGDLRHHGRRADHAPARTDGRGRDADMSSATTATPCRPNAAARSALDATARHLGGAADRAALAAVARRLHRARRPRAGAWPGGDVVQHPAGLHRRHELRPCGLFRPRRLRGRPDAEIPRRHPRRWRC